MPVVLIARFRGDVAHLTRTYDVAHKAIMDAGGPLGELRHHCAVDDDSLYIIGVWESEDALLTRFAGDELKETLAESGFPSLDQAELTILRLHAVEPPL